MKQTRTISICDLGSDVRYRDAFDLQERLVDLRAKGETGDTLLLLEHHAVYTLGRNAAASNVLITPEALKEADIDLCETTRGGDVTYHGPGQLVVYPIISLGAGARQVVSYVSQLERVLISLLASYGLDAGTDKRNRGVWVGGAKIAALGVRVTRGITMHGFALNVDPCMSHFMGIVPCGIQDAGVTSMRAELGEAPDMAEVKRRCVDSFCESFGCEARVIAVEAIDRQQPRR